FTRGGRKPAACTAIARPPPPANSSTHVPTSWRSSRSSGMWEAYRGVCDHGATSRKTHLTRPFSPAKVMPITRPKGAQALPLDNHAEFKLSITKALGDQLAAALEELSPAPLTEENINSLPRHKGVYQLYRHGEPVYIGKADVTLGQRLR